MVSDEEEATALFKEARNHQLNGCYDLARIGYLRAARLADAARALGVHANARAGLVEVDRATQRYDEVLRYADDALALCNAFGTPARLASLLECKAHALTETNQWIDARVAWRQAKKAMSDAGWIGWQVGVCDSKIAEASEHISKAVRAERLAAGPDVSRRKLFGRRWVR
ncbi:hypothetical protein [Brevundimonas sp. Root1423]|uniref:hypothetical protein n=1 Tax=Brevundimonas sp. Root1423 TaxID=1736462 RepID=UPI0012E379E6|nr:hypothetical protein [Brevundimonas sp. Root1423]